MEQVRILIATLLSFLIITGWQYFFVPELAPVPVEQTVVAEDAEEEALVLEREEIIAQTKRISLKNEYIKGSINLVGAQIDDVELLKYDSIMNDKQKVILLSPKQTPTPYFIKFNWKATKDKDLILPDDTTVWTSDNNDLTPEIPVTLSWESSQNISFFIKISLDDKYMMNIDMSSDFSKASVSDGKIRGNISIIRSISQYDNETMISHEGAIGVIDGKLKEIGFSDIPKEPYKTKQPISWLGFSDKYWLVSVIPNKEEDGIIGKFDSFISKNSNQQMYKMDYSFQSNSLKDDKKVSNTFKLFVGGKSLTILDDYEQKYNIKMFDHSLDFGMLYFITKPIFLVLNYFYKLLGNFGLAIMLLTIITKISLFPLAYKGVKSMNAIKKLQPKITKLKEQYADNSMLLQQAMMELYKKEKINPVSGCLPLILQMPIFFALYKVLYVTIEMRHAPFFLWIHDLSAPDPTTIFNLFGLIDWMPPHFLMIGVLPLLMSGTMFIQQSLSPQPTDPTQAMVMQLMPLVLLFMFSSFPSGLLLYWTWSNIISIGQQLLIKKISP